MPAFSGESPNLELDGPIIEVSVGLVRSAQRAMTEAGEAIPPPVKASALIDTGASGTVVQQGLLSSLGLHPVGSLPVNTPTSQGVPCALYAVLMELPNGFIEVTVIEAPLQGQNIQALIGRDILKHGIFIYQGHTSQFTLAF